MKTTMPHLLTPFSHKSRSTIRSILFATVAFATPMLIAAPKKDYVDPCVSVLLPQINLDTLDDQSMLAYFSQIDEQTWNDKKTDAGFIGKWEGFLGPMSGDFSYEHADQVRTKKFAELHYNASGKTAMLKLRQYLDDKQVEAWLGCIKLTQTPQNYGLFLLEKSVEDDSATFELRWIKPPHGHDDEPIESSPITGGKSIDPDVPAGQIYKKGDLVSYGSKIFTVTREPSRVLTVAVNAGGYGVTDRIDSSRILALEGRIRVLQNNLDAAVANLKAGGDSLVPLAAITVRKGAAVLNSKDVKYEAGTGVVTFPNPKNLRFVPIVSDLAQETPDHYITETHFIREIGSTNQFRVWRTPLDTSDRNGAPSNFTAIVIGMP